MHYFTNMVNQVESPHVYKSKGEAYLMAFDKSPSTTKGLKNISLKRDSIYMMKS